MKESRIHKTKLGDIKISNEELKMYKCDLCEKSFTVYSSLKRHLSTNHDGLKKTVVEEDEEMELQQNVIEEAKKKLMKLFLKKILMKTQIKPELLKKKVMRS